MKKIPDIQYVSLINKNMAITTNTSPGIQILSTGNTTTSNYGCHQIRLFKTFKIRINLKEVNSYKKAYKFAKIIAKGLDVKFLNATVQPPVFIEI